MEYSIVFNKMFIRYDIKSINNKDYLQFIIK